jgi:hypothetical protein
VVAPAVGRASYAPSVSLLDKVLAIAAAVFAVALLVHVLVLAGMFAAE